MGDSAVKALCDSKLRGSAVKLQQTARKTKQLPHKALTSTGIFVLVCSSLFLASACQFGEGSLEEEICLESIKPPARCYGPIHAKPLGFNATWLDVGN